MSEPLPLHRIGRLLGRGAVASVHEVFDDAGNRFAGKLLHASRDGDEVAATRFAQEAALLAGIVHPNLVRVDGEAEGVDEQGERRSFVRMELVEGEGLDEFLAKRGPLSSTQAIEFGRQLAEGLAHAHGRGIVHRDLKPANVLVDAPDSGRPELKIADFGMARASSLSGVSADALTILGTPDYMAPESLDPIAVDARADLYALGCMLFEMVTGTVPYPAATPFGILRRHRDDPLPVLDDAIHPELRALIHALLAKSPADRPSSAGLVAERLGLIGSGTTTALALAAPHVGASCLRCGQALVEHINVCLNCGLSTVHISPGRHSVLIVGPGEIGDKLDTALRGKLIEWLGSNPQLGLEASKALTKRIPRMPVVIASSVSPRSAEALVRTMQVLGLQAIAHEGMALRHPMVRKKTVKIAGRIGLIALTSMGGLWQFGWAAVALLIGAVGAIVGSSIYSARAVTEHGDRAPALGPGLRDAFDRVESVAGSLEEARHRHALRAVVRQSLDLRELLGPEHSDTELASAVDQASVTTAALAKIDADLRTRDLNDGGAETRALLHERDQLAGRMAELSGELEALRIRARRKQGGGELELELDELRNRVEALEEVMAS